MCSFSIVVRANVAAGEALFEVLEEGRVDRHHVFKVAVLGAVLHHQDLAVALDDLGLDFAHLLVEQNFKGQLAVQNLLARSPGRTWGTSESVVRGQPSGGFSFSQLFSRGLSLHLGVNAGLGLMRFSRSKTTHAPLAA